MFSHVESIFSAIAAGNQPPVKFDRRCVQFVDGKERIVYLKDMYGLIQTSGAGLVVTSRGQVEGKILRGH
jgi:hypothetical protein